MHAPPTPAVDWPLAGARPAAGGAGLRAALEDALGHPARVLTRPIDLAGFASDASLYRLVPRAVVQPRDEEEVRRVLLATRALGVPLTFRAAGTSLSGQAVSDGVLVDLSRHFSKVEVLDGGARVRFQPGAIAGRVNAVLRPHGRRIGPDPASIDSCMMGGVLANNASGMCCGIRENAYHTLDSIRFVLPGGLVVDTGRPGAGAALREGAPEVADGLLALRRRILGDPALAARIREKYRVKNTTGYGLEAFLDFDAPEEILAHLLVGSEGTLAFISEAVLRTFADLPHKRTGLVLFATAAQAFEAVDPFARSGARAVEFMDHACLRALRGRPGLDLGPHELLDGAAALLVEYQAPSPEELSSYRAGEDAVLSLLTPLQPARFTGDPAGQAALWKLRKGLFPAVGATKRSGETVIIEDVAFPLPRLPEATADLRALFEAHGYGAAILFGHAKDGNCHFVLTQPLDDPQEIARYERFMGALVELVVRHDGSLKAEHGTGRNMAPFVEAEWGREATAIMRELKALVDPAGLLNPGVILTSDPRAHVHDLKTLPSVEPEIDRCIECGFCEPVCPSRQLTLSPRRRIAVRRELSRLREAGDAAAFASLEADFRYAGVDTCAADGLCATACPVEIDTGALMKRLRAEGHGPRARRAARFLARHLGLVEWIARLGVRVGHLLEAVLGAGFLVALARQAERLLGVRLQRWSLAIPRVPAPALATTPAGAEAVYFPSCITRIMGQPREPGLSLPEILPVLAARAGVSISLPGGLGGSCCGLPFGSKGFPEEHALVLGRLVERLWAWSEQGRLPVVLDATSCLHGIHGAASLLEPEQRRRLAAIRLLDSVVYVEEILAARLDLRRLDRRVALHPTCAGRKLGTTDAMRRLAERCATEVAVPVHLGCCGMAGDRGLLHPELTASAVAAEGAEVRAGGFQGHYASNLTCEIGLSQATGLEYRSLLYLVEEASRPRP